jgi:NADPH:quinone reductase-like Zn-dependent oxidoreductase
MSAVTQTKTVRFYGYGDPDVLKYEDIDIAAPGPGEVLIRQTAIGINFIDIQQRKGRYPAKNFPVTPGGEGAGVIEAVGGGISEFKAGDRVGYMDQKSGGYCVTRCIAAHQVVKLPDFITDELAAAVGAATFDQSLACLKIRGLLVSFGGASGPVPPFDLFRLNNNHELGNGGSFYVTSSSLADYTRERPEYLSRVADLFEAVRAGYVRIRPPRRYALAEAARAHRDLESGATIGSSVLIP